ncbi:MAG: hypothetical protein JWN14_1154 [Chthonomonadales bacterium]|nr:hypothetical protein [Chthonomonadales bacterium]
MNSIKTTAEFYRRGLLMGLDLLAETMAWIDQTLVTEAVPDIALIEASLCGSQGRYAVADWMAQIPGECDKTMVVRHLLGRMLLIIDRDPAHIPDVTHVLYQMAGEDDWPDLAGERCMWSFWDDFDLAAIGRYGDPKEVIAEMRAFLLRAFLLSEVALFQQWAEATFPKGGFGEGEWEYPAWDRFWPAVLEFVAACPFSSWSQEELKAVLYALARDHEDEIIADELREKFPDVLLPLTRAAIEFGEKDARWQLAHQLGQLDATGGEPEQMLLALAHDEEEYVRRRALQALARRGSAAVEPLALEMWEREDPHQEWSRMMALSCLQRVGSQKLEPLLTEAERDVRPYLRARAEKIRRGEEDAF